MIDRKESPSNINNNNNNNNNCSSSIQEEESDRFGSNGSNGSINNYLQNYGGSLPNNSLGF